MDLLERYRLALDISPVPELLVDGEGTIVLANDSLLTLFGYDPRELVGESVEILVPEPSRDNHPVLREAYGRVPTKRSMGAGRDLYGVSKTGEIIPLELGLEPVTDGTVTYALVVVIDIRARRAQEERMRQAMDASASAMVMVNGGREIVFVNRAASDLFGYDALDMLGKPIELLVPEPHRRAHPVYVSGYVSRLAPRAMGAGSDLEARHADGHCFPVEIALTPVESDEGILVMSTIVDLTERRAGAEELARKNSALEAVNLELSHFAYSASHDLKAPLSSIAGLMALCIEDLDDGNLDEVRANMDKMLEISRRSARKVEGILRIARAGRDSVPVEDFRLDTLVQEVWTDLTGDRSETRLALELADIGTVRTEAVTLKLVLENLLSNALRYGDPGKTEHAITIGADLSDGMLHMRVSDNGLGIPEENQDKVFAMFKRLDDRSGDGLGLTLVKKQIARLQGTISLSSTEGEGTDFRFAVPLKRTQE